MLRTLAIVFALSVTGCLSGGIEPMPPGDDDDPPAGGPDAGEPVVEEPDAAPPPVDLMAEWSGCMDIADWDTAQMGTWANKPVDGGVVCASCHGDGLAGFYTNVDNVQMFEYNRYAVFLPGFFSIGDRGDGTLGIVPSVSKIKAMGNGLDAHPLYVTRDDDIYMQRLNQFVNLTHARKTAGGCGPAEYPPPPEQP